jgi:CubicO group peptidase (beta-lactamase class C family)
MKRLSNPTPNAVTAVVLCAAVLLAAIPLSAQDAEVPRTRTFPGLESPAFPYAQPEEVGLSSEILDRLGDEITEWVASGDLVGAELLIVKDGRAVFHEAYGWSDREERRPVERNSIWSIKSMSKPFTAAAVLMLAEEGELSLDDPVSRYIPGFAGDPRTTIRHLLTHTSGYRNADLGNPIWAVHPSIREWVEDWAARTPSGTLGTYEYTDFGFAAAGYIVEVVAGIPIGRFTEERIARPLRLADTSTQMSTDPAWRSRLNPWYRWNDDAGAYHLRWTSDFPGWGFYPAAWGMFSTAMDYARWMALWLNGGEWQGVRLLSEETVDQALREHARAGPRGYGYGWFVADEPRARGMPAVMYHFGGDGTMAIAVPDADAIVVFLTHSRGIGHGSALIEVLGMLEIFEHPGPGLVWSEGRRSTASPRSGAVMPACSRPARASHPSSLRSGTRRGFSTCELLAPAGGPQCFGPTSCRWAITGSLRGGTAVTGRWRFSPTGPSSSTSTENMPHGSSWSWATILSSRVDGWTPVRS